VPQQTPDGHYDQRLEQGLGQHELLDVELVAIQQQWGHPEGGDPAPGPGPAQRRVQQHPHRQPGQMLHHRYQPQPADQPDAVQHQRVQQRAHHPRCKVLGVKQIVIGVLQKLQRRPERRQHHQPAHRPGSQQHHQQCVPAQQPTHQAQARDGLPPLAQNRPSNRSADIATRHSLLSPHLYLHLPTAGRRSLENRWLSAGAQPKAQPLSHADLPT
jgi:hypothetical protein